MMKILNTAIIGCGSIFENHAAAVAGLDQSRLYAVCDMDRKKAEEAAKHHDCRFFTDFSEILRDKEIDIVHLCTPHDLHAPMAIEAMRSGKHVLTEKPMAITVEQATAMNRVSRETGKTLGVCFQNRYNATSQRIRDLLQSGRVGRILGAKAIVTWKRSGSYYTESNWRGRREREGGGVLINQAIHTLDLVQWFMGEMEGLKAHLDTRLLRGIIDVEDTAEATIVFKNGSSCIFYATNNYAANSPVELELIGENAVIRLRDDLTVTYADGTSEQLSETDRATGSKAYWGSSHKMLIRNFYGKIGEGKPFELDGEQGITAIRMIEAMNRSSETGEFIYF